MLLQHALDDADATVGEDEADATNLDDPAAGDGTDDLTDGVNRSRHFYSNTAILSAGGTAVKQKVNYAFTASEGFDTLEGR